MVAALAAVDSTNVAAQEPGVFPWMFSIDAGTVGAVLLTFLNDKVALGDPLVVVFRIVARHVELLLLSNSGDDFGNEADGSPGAED